MIRLKIYFDTFKYTKLSTYRSLNKTQLDFYRRYKAGHFSIISENAKLIIAPVDFYYLFFNLLLKWIPKICKGENVFGALINKELYGIIINTLPNGMLKIQEYCYRGKTSRDLDVITQEVFVSKVEFLNELYSKMLEFMKFHEDITGKDLKYYEDDLKKAKIAIDIINADIR